MERDRALKILQTDDVEDGAKEDSACAARDRKFIVYTIQQRTKTSGQNMWDKYGGYR